MSRKKKEGFQFEEALNRLEEITRNLESGDLSLDESLSVFEEGIRLRTLCTEYLTRAEKRLQILQKSDNGPRLVDFEAEGDEESSLF